MPKHNVAFKPNGNRVFMTSVSIGNDAAGDSSSSSGIMMAAAAAGNEDPDRGWTAYSEAEIRRLAMDANAYRWMHERTAEYYHGWHMWIGIPLVALSSITSTTAWSAFTATASTEGNDSSPSYGIQFAVGVISAIVAILGAIQTFVGFKTRSEAHKRLSSQFQRIFLKINREIINERQYRKLFRKFVSDINRRYEILQASPYLIPRHIEEEYAQARLHGDGMHFPVTPPVSPETPSTPPENDTKLISRVTQTQPPVSSAIMQAAAMVAAQNTPNRTGLGASVYNFRRKSNRHLAQV